MFRCKQKEPLSIQPSPHNATSSWVMNMQANNFFAAYQLANLTQMGKKKVGSNISTYSYNKRSTILRVLSLQV